MKSVSSVMSVSNMPCSRLWCHEAVVTQSKSTTIRVYGRASVREIRDPQKRRREARGVNQVQNAKVAPR